MSQSPVTANCAASTPSTATEETCKGDPPLLVSVTSRCVLSPTPVVRNDRLEGVSVADGGST